MDASSSSAGTEAWGPLGAFSHRRGCTQPRGPALHLGPPGYPGRPRTPPFPLLPALTDSFPRACRPGPDPGVALCGPARESEATGRASGRGALRPGGQTRARQSAGRAAEGGARSRRRPPGHEDRAAPRPAQLRERRAPRGAGGARGGHPGRPRGRRQCRAEPTAPRPQPTSGRKAGRGGLSPHLASRETAR